MIGGEAEEEWLENLRERFWGVPENELFLALGPHWNPWRSSIRVDSHTPAVDPKQAKGQNHIKGSLVKGRKDPDNLVSSSYLLLKDKATQVRSFWLKQPGLEKCNDQLRQPASHQDPGAAKTNGQ